ncbi:L-galactonate dehydratase [Penicillium riverlandense]|uniref:L-galactonate dehydratase n=1 Tax=Penicillium riverlandense TaxID=1903569 RepID=UPI0025487C73|nr:L-galactonate dehydratase [Penicillium riverlandense]KAJ5815382.1 L-galactonate dehydratase [Penicillium riverlandense]
MVYRGADIPGHAKIRAALKPYGIGVATGEHINNRTIDFVVVSVTKSILMHGSSPRGLEDPAAITSEEYHFAPAASRYSLNAK